MSIDPDKLKLFSFLLFSKLEGAVTSGMVHLGDRLGLYRALAAAPRALTTTQLAAATGLHERWVREWAYNQAAAKLISFSSLRSNLPTIDDDTFYLTPEQRAVLADESHPAFGMGMFHRLPQTMESLKRLPETFRTGVGYDYDSHGPEGAVGIERSFEPWNLANLLPVVTFDCIHDMTHPAAVMQAIRAALHDDGVWLLVDIKAHDGFVMNAEKNPMASLMYGVSVMSCLSSAMSTPDGAGLGTLGLSAGTAETMARAAGFTRFERLAVEHSVNAFYAIRP
ncbi:MAG: hypothetical protein EBY04_01740 [Actinobacteria bacterium]|nr:hypothetical protein [Actinomycetota bacterium]